MSGRPDWPGYPETYIFMKNPFLHPWNLIDPTLDMGLTSIPLVPSGGGWVQSLHWYAYFDILLPWNRINLNNPSNIILRPSTSYNYLHRIPNQNHSVIPIDITVLIPNLPCSDPPVVLTPPVTSCGVLAIFICINIFTNLTVRYHREYVLIVMVK